MLEILTKIIRRNEPVEPTHVPAPTGKSFKERQLLRAQSRYHRMEEIYGEDFLAPPEVIITRSS